MADEQLIPGTLSTDCYPPSAQAFYNEMFERGKAVGPDIKGLLIQDAAPDPVDRGVMGWVPTSGDIPIYPGYVFVWHATIGHWVSRHPVNANDASRRIYVGTSASIATYDGGDGGALTIGSGPMWALDAAFDGRTPVGVGVIPTSSPSVSILNPLDTQDSASRIGEYQHSLIAAEMPPHTHDFTVIANNTDSQGQGKLTGGKDDGPWDGQYDGTTKNAGGDSATPPVVAPHMTMQPFIGVYFIKRTLRQFLVAG